jgi:NAD(P)-dependent dehydrogenase (short-subunit alcohol dehydrogenase family)
MRTPREDILPRSERLRILPLDVTKPESIAAAIEVSGPIDVLVNNAGIGIAGIVEATPMAPVREVFETNTFGVMQPPGSPDDDHQLLTDLMAISTRRRPERCRSAPIPPAARGRSRGTAWPSRSSS